MHSLVADSSRLTPHRYFNLFRLIVAGLFLVAGEQLNLGVERPQAFTAITIVYLGLVLALGFPDATRRFGLDRLITLQVVIDIIALAVIMWISGGYRSAIPVMMMVYLAGAGLVAEGRMVLFYAALATVAVLIENTWRTYVGLDPTEFLQIGIACIGFFAIALTARLLARRAQANESLAELRGEALGRQEAINERIIEDMQDGVIVLGADGRVRQANPRASFLLGMDLREGMLLSGADASFAGCRMRCATPLGELERLGPAGRLLRCRALRANTNGDDDGDTLIYLTDFDEIQKQVQQLKLAALGRLTASMAHEIRNPLSAVTQAADLLGEEKRADVQTRLVRIINDNAHRIERLVREVLELGKRDEVVREALPVVEFVGEMIEELGLGGAQERAIFRVEIAPEETIGIDRAHLHQILGNLFSNARRYCSGRPGSIRIYTNHTSGDRVSIHVADDGPGVPAEQRAQVFEPFFTSDTKGTGLGLYIARELAEANEASLDLVGNAPGAHFVLTGRRHA
jgi:two-component system, NtrC family, sensor histidine kinase PilS